MHYLTCLLSMLTLPSGDVGLPNPAGMWKVSIECPGGQIQFGLELTADGNSDDAWQAFLINGVERIQVPDVSVSDDTVRLSMIHYNSTLLLRREKEVLIGEWTKRRGPDEWVTMSVRAVRPSVDDEVQAGLDQFVGRWDVKFESSEDPAVGIFKNVEGHLEGTFLTTTGDYRFLCGNAADGILNLSCFDGGHAFLFRASPDHEGQLKGHFWSSNTWHEKWTARKNANASLPDSFQQTSAVVSANMDALRFPGLDGIERSINDPMFAGKARIIYVFGSWCPNCHDAAAYFAELERRFGGQGLSIMGLAFELTGDFDVDRRQVKRYAERHGTSYPILIAGLSDKKKASEKLPILDRVRSYPTTIFLDRENRIRAVHTGFSGPATGVEYERLQERFELLIAELLED